MSWAGSGPTPAVTGQPSPAAKYTMNDMVKVNFAKIFEYALQEMMANPSQERTVASLWDGFVSHLRRAVEVVAEGLDFHMAHMYRVFPGPGAQSALLWSC